MDAQILSELPVWGIFSVIVIKLTFDLVSNWRANDVKPAPDKPAGPAEIAALVRDQQERAELLDTLRRSTGSQDRLADALGRVADAQQRIADSQDAQTQLIRQIETRDAEIIAKLGEISRRIAS